MQLTEYLDTHEVFTGAEFARAFDSDSSALREFADSLNQKQVLEPRSGVFFSRLSDSRKQQNSIETAQSVCPDAVFCYTTALRLHGCLHNLVRRTQFYTYRPTSSFSSKHHDYLPYYLDGRVVEIETFTSRSGSVVQVTSREQTVIDCLTRLDLAVGTENVLRSIGSMDYVNVPHLVDLALKQSDQTVIARLGWLLENVQGEYDWPSSTEEDTDRLHAALIEPGPFYYDQLSKPKSESWIPRWRLYARDSRKEMTYWLTH